MDTITALQGEPAGIYLRISDDREGKRLGVQRQEKDNRALAARLGVRMFDLYTDNDISASVGSTKPRPDYDRLLTDARSGRIKVIIAYSTSRLTRRPREHEDLIDLAVRHGIRFHFVASPTYDLNTADGREAARNAATRDTAEVERLRERIIRKKLQDVQDGKWNGGTRTYGYGKKLGTDPITERDVLDYNALVEDEVAILHECKSRILAGDSQLSIVKDLNARGIVTVKGHRWTVGKLKRSLLYKRYVIFDSRDPQRRGTRVHGDDEHQAVWPGIFTREENEMLRAVFQRTAQRWSHGPVRSRTYLLTGMTYCGKCGGAMYGQGRRMGGRYERRYHCKKYDNHGVRVGCCQVFRIADPVEKLVSDAVLHRFDSPEVARALAPADDEGRVNELLQTVAALGRRKEELAAEHALKPYDDYRTMVATLKAHIDAAGNELARLRSDKAKRLLLPADGGLRDLWEKASLEWRASVVRLLVERVVIYPRRPGAEMWHGWRFDPSAIEIVWRH
jgi:site-specific DNA recombinase